MPKLKPTSWTPMQRRVLTLAANGCSRSEMCDALGISPNTLKEHVREATRRNGARTMEQAVAQFVRAGGLV